MFCSFVSLMFSSYAICQNDNRKTFNHAQDANYKRYYNQLLTTTVYYYCSEKNRYKKSCGGEQKLIGV